MAKFVESVLAHEYLDNLRGVEIGNSAHNPFGLNTINVDKYPGNDTVYKQEEIKLCGESSKVDIVAPAWNLPFKDKTFDFVINSHVIEHCWDVIGTILEWERVATKYIFFNVPHVDRTFDKGRKITQASELTRRYYDKRDGIFDMSHQDAHHSVWRTSDFIDLLMMIRNDFMKDKVFEIVDTLDVDDKVGNGFMVVVKLF